VQEKTHYPIKERKFGGHGKKEKSINQQRDGSKREKGDKRNSVGGLSLERCTSAQKTEVSL